MRHHLVALALLAAGVAAGVSVAPSIGLVPIPAELSSQTTLVFQLGGLENLIERLDSLLEAAVDLLRTLGQLFGESGG